MKYIIVFLFLLTFAGYYLYQYGNNREVIIDNKASLTESAGFLSDSFWMKITPEELEKKVSLFNDINISRSKDGMTMLHLLIKQGLYLEAMDILVSFGADINAQDHKGYSSLHYAVIRQSNHYLWVKKLLEYPNININLRTKEYSVTPFLMAVDLQLPLKTIQLLIQNKSDIFIPSNDGTTPLILASKPRNGKINVELVQLLLDSGTSLTKKDKYGKSALSYMKENEDFVNTDFFKNLSL